MLEKSPTLGSIETSDWEKKQFALRFVDKNAIYPIFITKLSLLYRSIEFNLKNRIFCELFPELKSECEKEVETRKSQVSVANNNPQVGFHFVKHSFIVNDLCQFEG